MSSGTSLSVMEHKNEKSNDDRHHADEIKPQALSGWQLKLIRNALHAYYCYERTHEGESYDWKDVREAIAEYTGYEIGGSGKNGVKNGAERLRKFVVGVENKQICSKRIPENLSPAPLAAVVKFVTDETLDLLTYDELHEEHSDYQTYTRLHEYFARDNEGYNSSFLDREIDYYYGAKAYDDHYVEHRLTAQHPYKNSLFEATYEMYFFDPSICREYDPRSYKNRKNTRFKAITLHGWALLTPDMNILFFLKNLMTNDHTMYTTTVCVNDESGLHRIVLLQIDTPLFIEGNRNVYTVYQNKLHEHLDACSVSLERTDRTV